MDGLNPIKILPARERVASELRKAILSNEVKAGTFITLEGIASQLHVSHTPVREAFQMLNRDGLIIQHPNKGAEVVGINKEFIEDYFETRAILESACAEKVCVNGADLSEIEEVLEKSKEMLRAEDPANYDMDIHAFHVAIWDAAGNQKMKTMLSELWNGLLIGENVHKRDYVERSVREHQQIFDALRARDAAAARERMVSHIMRNMENIPTKFE